MHIISYFGLRLIGVVCLGILLIAALIGFKGY